MSASRSFGSKFFGSDAMYSTALLRHRCTNAPEPARRLAPGAQPPALLAPGGLGDAPAPAAAAADGDGADEEGDAPRPACAPAGPYGADAPPAFEYHPRTTSDRGRPRSIAPDIPPDDVLSPYPNWKAKKR